MIYRPKKFLTYIRLFLLIFLILFIDNSALTYAEIFTVENENLNKTVEVAIIEEGQEELHKEELYSTKASFKGTLTGYGGDCPLCSGVVACAPRLNVLEHGIFFDDKDYGTVRIVASSKNYPCGSILRFNVANEPIIAVIMDRGVSGNSIDLLTESEEYAGKHIGRIKNLDFEILRLGW